jgi:hypothetical protein
MVEVDLNYCCLWFFLTRFRRSRVVADRLGVDIRSVNYARERVKSGEEKCKKCERCLHKLVTMELVPKKPRGEV